MKVFKVEMSDEEYKKLKSIRDDFGEIGFSDEDIKNKSKEELERKEEVFVMEGVFYGVVDSRGELNEIKVKVS